jgi:hypothetical protein
VISWETRTCEVQHLKVRFQADTAMNMKVRYLLVCCVDLSEEIIRRVRDNYCAIRAIALIMEALRTSETSVNFNQTTECNIQEDSDFHMAI